MHEVDELSVRFDKLKQDDRGQRNIQRLLTTGRQQRKIKHPLRVEIRRNRPLLA